MKHHKRISRIPEAAQTEPTTPTGIKYDFMVRLLDRAIQFMFNFTGHNML